jgi:hypothetical protein
MKARKNDPSFSDLGKLGNLGKMDGLGPMDNG